MFGPAKPYMPLPDFLHLSPGQLSSFHSRAMSVRSYASCVTAPIFLCDKCHYSLAMGNAGEAFEERTRLKALPLSFETARQASELEPHVEAWEQLAQDAAEPNCFCEPWLLRPALEAFAGEARLHIMFAYAESGSRRTLQGVFPFERANRYRGLPLPHLRLWRHVHGYLATPLVRRGGEHECLAALMRHLRGDPQGCGLVEWDLVRGDGPFLQALENVARDLRVAMHTSRVYDRALLQPRAHAKEYLAAAFSSKRLREFGRLRRRLGELGEISFDSYVAGSDPCAWIEAFLALEASGWKGRLGSALGCTERSRTFFRRAACGAARGGHLEFVALRVGKGTVAMQCTFLSGSGAFAFKIAFDEAYSRYSPGMLLELETLERFHAQDATAWLDSCASVQHPTADRMWIDRRLVKTVVMSTGRAYGQATVALLPYAHGAARLMRNPVNNSAVA